MNDRLANERVTYEVNPRDVDGDAPLGASLKIAGDFGVDRDLNQGDELTVQVANADGEVIATGVAEVGAVGFPPIKIKGEVIGIERAHKAKLQ